MLPKERKEFAGLLLKMLRQKNKEEVFKSLRDVKDGNVSYRMVQAGDYIVREDSKLWQVMIVFKGEFTTWKSSVNGKNYLVHRLAAPQFIGIDRALHVEYMNTADCIATRNCEVLAINQEYFVRLLEENGELAVEILRNILTKMAISMIKANRESLYDAAEQMIVYLYFYIFGYKKEKSLYRLSSTKKELADSIGVSDRTLYRVLKKLKEEGYISVEKGCITIDQEQKEKIKEKALLLIDA